MGYKTTGIGIPAFSAGAGYLTSTGIELVHKIFNREIEE
jgi:hypothetical protein